MPFVELTESERPIKRVDNEGYSPERLMEAIISPEITAEFIKPPDPDWAKNRRRGRGEASRLRRGLLSRRRIQRDAVVQRPSPLSSRVRDLEPDERTLLALFVKLGRYAVCQDVPVALLAKKMRRSVRTIQRLLSSILEKFSGLVAKTRDGFRTAYCFSRDFLMAANAVLLRKKPGATPPHRREQILPPFERAKNLTNAEKDTLRSLFYRMKEQASSRLRFTRKPEPDPSTA